jgi:hypothetical protein
MTNRRCLLILAAAVLAGGCESSGQTQSTAPSASAAAVASMAQASPTTTSTPSSALPAPASVAPSFALGTGPIDPANFSATVDNPWFPLIPGTVYTSQGERDGKATDIFTVTHNTKVVDGVRCVVVDDRGIIDGVLEERTFDYYAQDLAGNVWYFGEDTQELDAKGKVTSTEGTWHAGVDGAVPGIFMEASPVVGHSYRQEYYKGHAEDQYIVKDLAASITVPYGAFTDVLLTEERTALEPDVLDHKYYVKGIGQVKEVAVKGPVERLELTKLIRP